jgi:hypothetical protein
MMMPPRPPPPGGGQYGGIQRPMTPQSGSKRQPPVDPRAAQQKQ